MNSRTVIFRKADPDEADAMKAMIAQDMAKTLVAECFDLTDNAAVIRVLANAFGSQSAAELWEAARDLARQAPPSGTRH